MTKVAVNELDIFYISYDEPNCEKHWADLLNKVPWAKRVHGVKGFDAAHKACAMQSETERFITVDGDNVVMDDFFEQTLDFPSTDRDGHSISESIFSWNAKNLLNGLVYGNGGLKCWPTEYTKTIQTHESSDDEEGMEFCWKLNYIQLNDIYSEIHQTASPFQAFRSGFREGVKMSLDQGKRVNPDKFKERIWYGNYNRLQTWCNIGSDVENGLWAIYGARLGAHNAILDLDFVTNQIADYEWFKTYFVEQQNLLEGKDLYEEACTLGRTLNEKVNSMMLFDPDENVSRFFKQTYTNPRRWGSMVSEKQILDLLEKGML